MRLTIHLINFLIKTRVLTYKKIVKYNKISLTDSQK